MILFIPARDDPRGFEVRVIDRQLTIGSGRTLTPLDPSQGPRPTSGQAWLVPWSAQESPGRGVVLLTRASSVQINGRPALPLTVLHRGDEIRIDGTSLFFSDEMPLKLVSFSPGRENGSIPDPVECTRCHGPINLGDPVVYCPACSALYMAQPNHSPNCWEFGPCVCCGRDPKLEFSWQPKLAAPAQPWQSRAWRAALTAAQAVAPRRSTGAGGTK
jgi:hypothetical protein